MNIVNALLCVAITTVVYMSSLFTIQTKPPKSFDEETRSASILESVFTNHVMATNVEELQEDEPNYDGMILCSNTEEKSSKEENKIQVETMTLKEKLLYENQEVVQYTIEYPKFTSTSNTECIESINKYYEQKALNYEKHVQADLYQNVIQLYQEQLELSEPIPIYEAISTYKVTNTVNNILSIYTDVYEFTGGAHGTTTRDSQNWSLRNCKCLTLEEVFNKDPNYQNLILEEIEAQMSKEKDKYFLEDGLAKQTFNPNHFYVTEEGVVIYYQQYDIAPYAAGIVEFLIKIKS